MARLGLMIVLGFLGALGTGCSVNPATGGRSLTLMSWSEEVSMGAQAAPQFTEEFGGGVPDAALQDYVSGIGNAMVAHVEAGVPDLDWEFTLLDSDVINAFALPGGKVFLTRGLARKLDSEAEVAGVIGHEIGHVTARHGNQRISKQIGFNLALGAAAVAVGVSDSDSDVRKVGQIAVPAVAIGGNVVLLKYGRDEETEADMLGMRYMSRAGYNPEAQLEVMRVLAQAGGSGARPPEWLSTHPFPETRIERIEGELGRMYPNRATNPTYGFYPERYGDRMLRVLDRLPAARHSSASADLGASLWCAHCAAARSDSQAGS